MIHCYGLYATKYNTSIEPAEIDIIKMFNDMGATITTYDDTYITIPWKYIVKWERAALNGVDYGEYVVIYFLNQKNSITMHLAVLYKLDPLYRALSIYAGEKEDRERPLNKNIVGDQTRQLIFECGTVLIVFVIAYIICWCIL